MPSVLLQSLLLCALFVTAAFLWRCNTSSFHWLSGPKSFHRKIIQRSGGIAKFHGFLGPLLLCALLAISALSDYSQYYLLFVAMAATLRRSSAEKESPAAAQKRYSSPRLSISGGAKSIIVYLDHVYLPGVARGLYAKPAASLSNACPGTSIGVPFLVGFTMPVKTPGDSTTYHLFIDLGSPLTWLEDNTVIKKKGYKDITHNIQTQYGDNTVFRGVSETAILRYQTNPTETIVEHFIAKGHLYDNITAVDPKPTSEMCDGMLGLSPATGSELYVYDLVNNGGVPSTRGRASGIETLVSALGDNGIFGVFFKPHGACGQAHLSLKDFDGRKFLAGSQPIYTPIVDKHTGYWQIKQTLKYGARKAKLPGCDDAVALIDTGYAFIDLPATGYAEYKKKTGAVEKQGRLVLTAAQYRHLESLWISIDGYDFEFTKDAQLWPRSLNKGEGFADDDYVLCISNLGNDRMVFGHVWFQRFYVIVDNVNDKIGVVPTNHTHAEVNELLII